MKAKKAKKAKKEGGMIEYVDAQEMARQYPDTFGAPTNTELAGIHKGSTVKVCHNDERFWVTVTRITKKGGITGFVNNDLICDHPFKGGDRITFETRNVYSIYEE